MWYVWQKSSNFLREKNKQTTTDLIENETNNNNKYQQLHFAQRKKDVLNKNLDTNCMSVLTSALR